MYLWQDLRLAARRLVKDRRFAAVIVLTIALGIAANTTVFTILNGAFLHDLPFDAPDRVVDLTTGHTANGRVRFAGLSLPELKDWQANARTFDAIGAFRETAMNVADETGPAARFRGAYLSANAFSLIGERPALGRDFRPEDDRPGAEPVVLIGHSTWRSRYGFDPAVIGRTIRVNGISSTVIGVMPERFGFPRNAELWQPLALLPANELQQRTARRLTGVGRLKPGVTIEQTRADLSVVAAALAQQFPDTNASVEPRIRPFREAAMGNQGRVVFSIMMAAVGFLLLIACANVANLLLARAVDRSREISVRMSIGASRWRIVQQLLAEGLLLALVAGTVGLGLSLIGVQMFSNAFVTPADPYWLQFVMDAQVFAFLAAVSLGTVVLFGLVPALHTAGTSIADVLSKAGRGATGSLRGRRWMGTLVVVQLTLAIVLLTSAGLAIRDAIAQSHREVGIETAGVTLMHLNLPALEYPTVERRAVFYRQLGERLASLPATRATFASAWPHGGTFSGPREISIGGQPEAEAGDRPVVSYMVIGPRYFESLGTKPVRGRGFSDADRSGSAIVNERFAAIHFPDRDPIGQRVRIEPTADERASEWLTIVGVAPNVLQHRLLDAGRGFDPVVYVPYASLPLPFTMVLVRSDLSQSVTVSLVRDEIRALDPDLPLFDVMPLDETLAADRGEIRALSTMFTIFATIALVLAAVGLYSVTAYAVSQRTREIGIRVALGAPARRIWWLVTRRASVHIAIGLVLGTAGALGAGQILEGLLETVSGTDTVAFFGVAVMLVIVALVACLIPARRAIRLDPVVALRHE